MIVNIAQESRYIGHCTNDALIFARDDVENEYNLIVSLIVIRTHSHTSNASEFHSKE